VCRASPLLKMGYWGLKYCPHRGCLVSFQFVNCQGSFSASRHRDESDAIIDNSSGFGRPYVGVLAGTVKGANYLSTVPKSTPDGGHWVRLIGQ
jgi:hypothetical protein